MGTQNNWTRNVLNLRGAFVAIVCAILAGLPTGFAMADAGCCLLSASGSPVNVSTPVIKKNLASVSIGCNGGDKNKTVASADIEGLVSTGALHSQAFGTTGNSNSESTVNNLLVVVGGNVITSTTLSSSSEALCNGTASTSGSSLIQNLMVNGTPISVTGQPNQRVSIVGGEIIINEQKRTGTGCIGNLSVTALKVLIPGVATVSLAKSHAGVGCIQLTCGN